MQNNVNSELLRQIIEYGCNFQSKKDVIQFLIDNNINPAISNFDKLVEKILQRFMIGKYAKRRAQLLLDYNEIRTLRNCYLKQKQAYDYAFENNVKAESIIKKSFDLLEKYIKQLVQKYLDKYNFKIKEYYIESNGNISVLTLCDSFADGFKTITGSYRPQI